MGGPAERKVDFLNKILPLIQPGDVINFDSTTEWYNLHLHAAYWAIRRHQRQMFGNLSRWRDVHSMLYLDEDQVFSVEPPRARFVQLEELYEDTITLWRYTKREFADADLEVMADAAAELEGTVYDVGQLLDIAVNHIMGYPHTIHYRIFDFSRFCKVCSVGVRVCYEALRKHLEQQGAEPPMKRLFSSFKYDTWLESDIVMDSNTELRGVDVEATSPAHFANSEWFDDEFEMVAQFDRGQQVYPSPPQPAAPEPEAGAGEAHDDHGDHDAGH